MEKLFSITKKDFTVEHIRGSGAGGQHKNKVSTGVRIKHNDSGAVGEATEERSQEQNKKNAFMRMYNSDTFQKWLKIATAKAMGTYVDIDKKVDDWMQPQNLKVEEF